MRLERNDAEASTLVKVAQLIEAASLAQARALVTKEMPWASKTVKKRPSMTAMRAIKIFVRDGFVDRYSGGRLIFPGALMLMHHFLQGELPAGPTWKISESHPVFWKLWPVVDHVDPYASEGNDGDKNLVTTSVFHNGLKSAYRLQDLGWSLVPPGEIEQWDGLVKWFVRTVETDLQLRDQRGIQGWLTPARAAAKLLIGRA